MEIRIREFRRRRGLTLQQLATQIGTTAQTVQRLETGNMTVSTDWLERFANIFGVHPADLIGGGRETGMAFLGRLAADGSLQEDLIETSNNFSLEIPADNPVAVRLERRTGPYDEGSILIANRLSGGDMVNAHGSDCIVALQHGPVLLRRVIAGKEGGLTLVPLTPGEDVRYDQSVSWLARIIMSVKYV